MFFLFGDIMFIYITIFLVSFTIALSGSLMPGPLFAATVCLTTRHGFIAGPMLMAGHAISEAVMVALIVAGTDQFINNPFVIKGISGVGAVILIYFGINMVRSARGLCLESDCLQSKSANLVFEGITLSIANPYWSIWWLTIGLGFVLGARKTGVIAVAVFFIGHILADILWYCSVAYAVSKSRKFISDKVYRTIIIICGVSLIVFGIYFGLSAFSE